MPSSLQGGLWRNPTMAATFDRLCTEAEAAAAGVPAGEGRRQAEITAMREIWR